MYRFQSPRSRRRFRVKTTLRGQLAARKRQIESRLDKTDSAIVPNPCLPPATFVTKSPNACMALPMAALGALHLLARRLGLIDAIDKRLHLLKIHLPYHES